MKILCIDDEPLALRLLAGILEKEAPAAELCCFDNAEEALARAEDTVFDAVFTDILLGDANGLDLAERLRAMQPSCKIVYCTGYPQYAVESINRGIVDGYLIKPVEDTQVRELLDRFRSRGDAGTLLTVRGSGTRLHIYDAKGQEVIFQRKKTMQLFSILLELEEHSANVDALCERLWEHKGELIYKNRQYLYALSNDMNSVLKKHGAAEVFFKTAGGYALDMTRIRKND